MTQPLLAVRLVAKIQHMLAQVVAGVGREDGCSVVNANDDSHKSDKEHDTAYGVDVGREANVVYGYYGEPICDDTAEKARQTKATRLLSMLCSVQTSS
jgi:hypothetical protein